MIHRGFGQVLVLRGCEAFTHWDFRVESLTSAKSRSLNRPLHLFQKISLARAITLRWIGIARRLVYHVEDLEFAESDRTFARGVGIR